MTHIVRADALGNYIELVAELGGDAKALLRAAQVPEEAVHNPAEAFVSFRTLVQLVEISAAALACEDFGLKLGLRQGPDIFGPVAVAAQNSETLDQALACFSRYFHTHNPAFQLRVVTQPGGRAVQVRIDTDFGRVVHHRQFDERSLALAHRTLSLLSDGRYQPQRLLLPHRRISERATYRESFGCIPLFDQPVLGIELSAADLRLPVRGNNPQLRKLATLYLDSQGQQSLSTGARVKNAIRPMLASGQCSHEGVAGALLLHPRTLQRRLAEESTSFEELRDAVRSELAERYLTTSKLPLSQVTALLGYSEQSALTRSCRRWFSLAPLALRRQASNKLALG